MRQKLILILSLLATCSCASTKKSPPISAECVIPSPGTSNWIFGCAWTGSCDSAVKGTDRIGKFVQTTIHLQSQGIPLTETIRKYHDRPVSLFSVTYEAASPKPVVAFPDFDHLPARFHVMSYRDQVFSPPVFQAKDSASPWVLFDDNANTFIISPASHFLIQQITGDAKLHITSQLRATVTSIPAGFTQQTLVAYGRGINHTWDEWGRALTDLQGKSRPASDADAGLKYLGYWTDNGTFYYYHYDPSLGYGGTMLALAKYFRDRQIPVKYFQLDSWWYYKTFTGPDGKIGKIKNAKLPPGEWNRYGGLLEYRAHPAVLPQGLQQFQRDLGLPLITHNRWIDPASPYHNQYRITGFAAIDPAFWQNIIRYIARAGVITYEQDWLVDIYNHSPELASSVTAGDDFTGGMANACAKNNLAMQYCMATPAFFLQGSKYSNLTTIRCSGDRLIRPRWRDFLYTSRLASAVGIWPWTDPYLTSETGNILLSDLSAGMVGFGDEMGTEDTTNIFRAVRADGVIVKPDAPIVPLDSAYIAEANGQNRALLASTFTDHAGIRTQYLLAFRVPSEKKDKREKEDKMARPHALSDREQLPPTTQSDITNAQFSLADLGLTTPAYCYNFLTQQTHRLEPVEDFDAPLGDDGFSYYVVAQPGISGIAFFGDMGKFVSAGKQRIASLNETTTSLTANLIFAPGENHIRLHGCCKSPVKAKAGGQILDVSYDPASQHFYFDVDASLLSSFPTAADSTRRIDVILEKD